MKGTIPDNVAAALAAYKLGTISDVDQIVSPYNQTQQTAGDKWRNGANNYVNGNYNKSMFLLHLVTARYMFCRGLDIKTMLTFYMSLYMCEIACSVILIVCFLMGLDITFCVLIGFVLIGGRQMLLKKVHLYASGPGGRLDWSVMRSDLLTISKILVIQGFYAMSVTFDTDRAKKEKNNANIGNVSQILGWLLWVRVKGILGMASVLANFCDKSPTALLGCIAELYTVNAEYKKYVDEDGETHVSPSYGGPIVNHRSGEKKVSKMLDAKINTMKGRPFLFFVLGNGPIATFEMELVIGLLHQGLLDGTVVFKGH